MVAWHMPLPGRGVLVTCSADPGHVIALYNPLIIACFTRPAKPIELQTLSSLASQGLAEGIRGGLLYVVARKEMTGGIDPFARATLEKMMRQNASESGANAAVILTPGFGGALLRSFLAGLLQLSSRRKLLQVFGSTEEACRWLAQEHQLDAKLLLRAYEAAAAHLSTALKNGGAASAGSARH